MIDSEFQEKGYKLIKKVIEPEFLAFITQYCFFREQEEFKGVGDPQSPGQFAHYGDALMETLLLTLQDNVEADTGLTLYPTYSYFRVYRNGSILDPHTDRESCQISATVCINYDYSTHDYKWPIFMNGTEIVMEPGDMVIYKGCEIPHWRLPLDNKLPSWHIQTFLHYVDVNGPYAEFKYDKRESLGRKKDSQFHSKPYIISA